MSTVLHQDRPGPAVPGSQLQASRYLSGASRPRHLLVIYYNFPPVKVPGALRVYHLCRTAVKYFDSVQALTTSNRRFFQQDKALQLPEIPLTEVPARDLRWFTTRRKTTGNRPFISSTVKESFWGRRLRRLVDSFPFNIIVGDGGLVYILRGYRAAKRLVRRDGITHLFSTFRPYSDHVIAFLLKRRFPHLVWIADFRDIHLDEKQGRQLYGWPLQIWFNRKVLAKADMVTTVSSGLLQKLAPFAERIVLLRNGIPATPACPPATSDLCFSLTYTGRIYPEEQTAELLFEVVAELIAAGALEENSVRLTYAGPTPEYWRNWALQSGLDQQLDIRGLIALQDARCLQQAAAINVSLSFSSAEQKGDLSSKIYEYLAAGKAVLAIVNGEEDEELEAFFADLAPGLLVYHRPAEKEKLRQFVLERYRAWLHGTSEQWPKNQAAATALRTDAQFGAFFERVVGGRG